MDCLCSTTKRSIGHVSTKEHLRAENLTQLSVMTVGRSSVIVPAGIGLCTQTATIAGQLPRSRVYCHVRDVKVPRSRPLPRSRSTRGSIRLHCCSVVVSSPQLPDWVSESYTQQGSAMDTGTATLLTDHDEKHLWEVPAGRTAMRCSNACCGQYVDGHVCSAV